MPILKWKDIAGRSAFHAARTSISGNSRIHFHGHDFAEVFWINSGQGLHQINGAETPLQPGTLVFIRPIDYHGFLARRGQELRQTNIAFSQETLIALSKRYFPRKQWAFSHKEKLPISWTVDPITLQRFNRWADELATAPRDFFSIERFLLNLLAEFMRESEKLVPEGAPDWLATACRAIHERENFSGGVERFLALCGRSREHAARTMRQVLGTTPTNYVNRIRMAYARSQLEMGDREILEIALDCGLGNLSHFYSLFRESTGLTPRAYRLTHSASPTSPKRRGTGSPTKSLRN